MDIYERNIGAIKIEDQIKLNNSTVLVCGVGGLGGYVVSLLARVGVEHLKIVDKDKFEYSDLNRHAFAGIHSVGKLKAFESLFFVKTINPNVGIHVFADDVNDDEFVSFAEGSNVIVDALDNIPSRLHVQKVARDLEIPLVHGAVMGMEGQAMIVFPEDKGLECLYEGSGNNTMNTKSVLGVSACVIGSFMASSVINVLIGKGKLARNSVFHFNSLGEGISSYVLHLM